MSVVYGQRSGRGRGARVPVDAASGRVLAHPPVRSLDRELPHVSTMGGASCDKSVSSRFGPASVREPPRGPGDRRSPSKPANAQPTAREPRRCLGRSGCRNCLLSSWSRSSYSAPRIVVPHRRSSGHGSGVSYQNDRRAERTVRGGGNAAHADHPRRFTSTVEETRPRRR